MCFICGAPDHQKQHCLKFKPRHNTTTQKDTSKEIVLRGKGNNVEISNMAKVSNAGRTKSYVNQNIPHANNLENWVMDSGATCHMTQYKDDFMPGSEKPETKSVEVADGFAVSAPSSGTVIIDVVTDQNDDIKIRIHNVLYVPGLAQRLFSLMSLIEEGHNLTLSNKKGIMFNFGKHVTVTMKLPNNHLFASQAVAERKVIKLRKTERNNKEIGLDLFYKRLGHRSIKTFLSANKDDIWDNTEIKLQNDLVSTSDHYIATIQKRARNTDVEPDTKLKPGKLLCLYLIKSLTKVGLTPDTTYKFYLLAVDGYSRLPKLAG